MRVPPAGASHGGCRRAWNSAAGGSTATLVPCHPLRLAGKSTARLPGRAVDGLFDRKEGGWIRPPLTPARRPAPERYQDRQFRLTDVHGRIVKGGWPDWREACSATSLFSPSAGVFFRLHGSRMLAKLRWAVAKQWRRWLGRRNRGQPPSWEQFDGMLRIFPLIPARIVHSVMC